MSTPRPISALASHSTEYNCKRSVFTSVDFLETEVETDFKVMALIQPQSSEAIKKMGLDRAKRNIMIHSLSELMINDKIQYRGRSYRILDPQDWGEYGFFESLGVEILNA
jgi:hypothetical protein